MILERVARSLDELARTLGCDATYEWVHSGARSRARGSGAEMPLATYWSETYRALYLSAIVRLPVLYRPSAVDELVERGRALFGEGACDGERCRRYAAAMAERGTRARPARLAALRVFDGTTERPVERLADFMLLHATANTLAPTPAEPPLAAAALEAAIDEDPYDPARYAVYADHLQEHGDPRGELIALYLENELRARPAIRERIAELFEVYGPRFLGPLERRRVTYDRATPLEALHWRFGFIHRVRALTSARTPSGAIHELLHDVLAHPSGRFVAEIELGVRVPHAPVQPIIDRLATPPRSLRRLVLGDDPRWPQVGDLAAAWPGLARLHELRLCGDLQLGRIVLPALRSFELAPWELDDARLASLAHAEWPRLERLSLRLAELPRSRAILDYVRGLDHPTLVDVAFESCSFADDLVEALARAPIRHRLRALSLSGGTLTDRGARQLVAAGLRLERLDVTETALSRTGERALKPLTQQLAKRAKKPPR